MENSKDIFSFHFIIDLLTIISKYDFKTPSSVYAKCTDVQTHALLMCLHTCRQVISRRVIDEDAKTRRRKKENKSAIPREEFERWLWK
jgi:hypothetical protein